MEHVVWGEVPEGLHEDTSIDSSDEDFERRFDHFLYGRDGFLSDGGAQFEAMENSLNDRTKLLDLEIDKRILFDDFETKLRRPQQETLKILDEVLDKLKQQELDKLAKRAEKEKLKIEEETRTARKKMLRNIGLALFGAIAVGTLIYFLVKWLTSDKKTSDEFTPEDADNAEKMITAWKSLDETQFWARIEKYVEESNPSFDFQMQMMGYTKLLADDKNAPKFDWTPTQKLDAIDYLVNAFTHSAEKKGKKSAAIYKALPDIKPDGRQLPRSIAADITELALAHIIALGDATDEAA
jgi:hypothetical protein